MVDHLPCLQGCSSVVEPLPSLHETLEPISVIEKAETQKEK